MITKKLRQLRVHQLQLSLLSHTAKNPSPFGGFTFNLVKKQFVEILVGPLEVGPLYSIDEFLRDICWMNKKNESFLDLWNLTGPSPVVSTESLNFSPGVRSKGLGGLWAHGRGRGTPGTPGRHGTTVDDTLARSHGAYPWLPVLPQWSPWLFSRCFNDFLGHLDARIGRPNSFDDWPAMFQNAKCLGWVQFTDLDEAPGGMVRVCCPVLPHATWWISEASPGCQFKGPKHHAAQANDHFLHNVDLQKVEATRWHSCS